uniref:Secreted protein n=1 Tax=Musa acuminata subsp. malaccensis TaxID=214687 RepID=A0A804KRH5_MUSAM
MYSCLTICFLLVLRYFACKNVSSNKLHLSPFEPPGWHRAGWGFGYIPGVEHSFASSHVALTGTCCRARDQVSGCLWDCSCSFNLLKPLFSPSPSFLLCTQGAR